MKRQNRLQGATQVKHKGKRKSKSKKTFFLCSGEDDSRRRQIRSLFEYAMMYFMTTLGELLEKYPEAKLLNSGGGGDVVDQPEQGSPTDDAPKQRGGRREGAGRPPLPEDAKKRVKSFTLDSHELAILRDFTRLFQIDLGRKVSASEALGIILRQCDDVGLKKLAREYAHAENHAGSDPKQELEGTQKIFD